MPSRSLLAWVFGLYAVCAEISTSSTPSAESLAEHPSQLATLRNGSLDILIVVSSETGWTLALARHVLEGCQGQVRGDESPVLSVYPIVKDASCTLQFVNSTNCQDVEAADGIIVGTPVYFASMAGEVSDFFKSWQTECFGWPHVKTIMATKAGGAFCTGGQQASGKDTARINILGAMTSAGVTVTGGASGFGASADHPDSATSPNFTVAEVDEARALGQRVVQLAARLSI